MEEIIFECKVSGDTLTLSVDGVWSWDKSTTYPVYLIRIQWLDKMKWCVPPTSPVLGSIACTCLGMPAWIKIPYGDDTQRNEGSITTSCAIILEKNPEESKWSSFLEAFASQTQLRDYIPYRLIQTALHPDRVGRSHLTFYDDAGRYVEHPFSKFGQHPPVSTVEGTLLSESAINKLK